MVSQISECINYELDSKLMFCCSKTDKTLYMQLEPLKPDDLHERLVLDVGKLEVLLLSFHLFDIIINR